MAESAFTARQKAAANQLPEGRKRQSGLLSMLGGVVGAGVGLFKGDPIGGYKSGAQIGESVEKLGQAKRGEDAGEALMGLAEGSKAMGEGWNTTSGDDAAVSIDDPDPPTKEEAQKAERKSMGMMKYYGGGFGSY